VGTQSGIKRFFLYRKRLTSLKERRKRTAMSQSDHPSAQTDHSSQDDQPDQPSPAVCCSCPRANCTCHPLILLKGLIDMVSMKTDFIEAQELIDKIREERLTDPTKYPSIHLQEKQEELNQMIRRNREQMIDLLIKQNVEEDSIQRFIDNPRIVDIRDQ
jgi:hypothetical protein